MFGVYAITTVTEYIRAAIENKQLNQSCLFNLQKAFDTLNHEILLQKMQNYGFRGKLLSFIASFLKCVNLYITMGEQNQNDRLLRVSHKDLC